MSLRALDATCHFAIRIASGGARSKQCLGICLIWLVGANATSVIAQTPATSLGQAYPTKPVRYVLPSTGGSEIVARIIAPGMSQALGQQVFVDVRTGAGGNLGAEIAAKAPADGYTILQVTQSHAVNMTLFRNPGYDLLRDFAAISKMDVAPAIVVVHPSLPVKTLRDLVVLAKARPGEINYGSAGSGTSTYLAAELFKSMAGINLTEVPYRGGAASQTAVVAGEVSVYFAPIATALPLVRDNRLRVLAVSTAKRLPTLPQTPTVAESGYPNYEASNWHGLVAPAKTPRDVINTLRNAVVSALNQPELNRRMRELGYTLIGDTPEEFAAFLRADVDKWRAIVRQKGLTAD